MELERAIELAGLTADSEITLRDPWKYAFGGRFVVTLPAGEPVMVDAECAALAKELKLMKGQRRASTSDEDASGDDS